MEFPPFLVQHPIPPKHPYCIQLNFLNQAATADITERSIIINIKQMGSLKCSTDSETSSVL